MKSQYFIDQPKAVLFYHRLTPPQQTDQLVGELCHRFMDFYVKSHPIEKMPEVLAGLNPQQFATIILMTKDLLPSPNIIESIGRCETTNNLVILYPNVLPINNKNVILASNKWEVFNAVSNQWAQYNNNKSFNRGKLNNQVGMPPSLQSADAQKIQSVSQQYGSTQMPVGAQPNMPPFQPINICILNNRNDKQYNELIGTLKTKYGSNPGVVFRQFNDINELLSKPNTAAPQSIVILGGQDPPSMAKRMADFNRGGYQSTIFYHPTVVTDPQTRQAFRYVVQDYPTMDRIVADSLNKIVMTRQPPHTVYQTPTMRSPSAPSTLVTSQVIDVREQQARHLQTMTGQQQYSTYNQQATQMMNMRGSRFTMAPSSIMANTNGRPQIMTRPVSAENHKIRMHSAWKLHKQGYLPKMGGGCLPKMGGQPVIYALDYIDKSIRPSFLESVNMLHISPAFHPLDYLIPQKISPKSILLAPYERRHEVLGLLQSGLKKKMAVVMYSPHLQPDQIIGHPQVELVTDNFNDIGVYLRQKGIKISPVPIIPNQAYQQLTSIAVLPMMRTSQVILPIEQHMSTSQVALLRQGQHSPQPLPMVNEQHTTYINSGIGSGVRPPQLIIAPSLVVTEPNHAPPVRQSNVIPQVAAALKQPILTSALKPTSPMSRSIITTSGSAVMMQSPVLQTYTKEWQVRKTPHNHSFAINESPRMIGQLGGSMVPVPSIQNIASMTSQSSVGTYQTGIPLNRSLVQMNLSASQINLTNKPPSPTNPTLQVPNIRQTEKPTNMPFAGVGTPIGTSANRLTFNQSSTNSLQRSNTEIMAAGITPQLNGNINGPQLISTPRIGDDKQSLMNIHSNQSIIDAKLDPSIRQSQNIIQSKVGSLTNIPPPTAISNILNQSPMLNFQSTSATRPMEEGNQVSSTISGASEYPSDPNGQQIDTALRYRRGKKKKKTPNIQQYNNAQLNANSEQQQLFPISEERRQSGILSDVSFQQSGMSQSESASLPSVNRMATPALTSQGDYPQQVMLPTNPQAQQNRPQQHQPQIYDLNTPMILPPHPSQQINARRTVLDLEEVPLNQNQPHLTMFQQTYNSNPDIKFVQHPYDNKEPNRFDYLQVVPGSLKQIPLEENVAQIGLNWIVQNLQNQAQMSQQISKPRQQTPENNNNQPPASIPIALQKKISQPFNIQPYPPNNMYPSQPNPPQSNTRPSPAHPLTPLDDIDDPRPDLGSGNSISESYQNSPAIQATESLQIRNPYQSFYPESQPIKTTIDNNQSSNLATQPFNQYSRTIYGQQKILPNEYEFQPIYGTTTGRMSNMYDSIAKASNSTGYENGRSNNHINTHIRIQSSNLAESNSNSNSRQLYNTQPAGQAVGMLSSRLSHDLYDIRIENGVTIYSRKSGEVKRSHSVDGSPPKVQVVRHMTSDLGNVLVQSPNSSSHNINSSYAYRSVDYQSAGINNYVRYQSMNDPHKFEYGIPARIERTQQMVHVREQSSQRINRSRSVNLEEYTRLPSTGGIYGVLYMCPRTSDRIHQALYKICTPFDKIRMYSSNDELRLVKWSDYGAVLIFPLDEKRLLDIQQHNVFFVLMNTPSRNSQQIAIQEIIQLKQFASRYHRAPIVTSNTHKINEYVYRPSYEQRQLDTAVGISGQYKVLLRDNLRGYVQLDAFIEPELFDLNNIRDKMHRLGNYIIIIGQDQVDYVRPHKKQTDRLMVLAQNHHPRISNAYLWTPDAYEIEQAVRNVLSHKRILNSQRGIFNNTRPTVYFSLENPQIYEEVQFELGQYLNLVKYENFNNLLSKVKQNRDDFSIVVMNRVMSRHIPSLKNSMREGKFLIYEKKGYGSTAPDPDVIETPTITTVVRTIRSLI